MVTSLYRCRPIMVGEASTSATSSASGRSAAAPEKTPPRMAPCSRTCRVTARVSTPLMPTIPCARSSSTSSRCDRQFEALRAGSRTTNPDGQIRRDSLSSSLTPVLPMCGAVITTICRWYDGSVRVSWYPVMPVVKTTSPVVLPSAP